MSRAAPWMYPELSGPLYHGSAEKIETVDVSSGAAGKDFGRGFYTSASRIQAEKFALLKGKRIHAPAGFVSVFRYIHNPRMNIKKFTGAGIDWLLFVLENRGFLDRKKAADSPFDIIIGPVADDVVGLVLNQLLIGTYGDPLSEDAQHTAIRLLDPEKLCCQIFFGTREAADCLEFQEAFEIGIK